jgi:hypothetical protein
VVEKGWSNSCFGRPALKWCNKLVSCKKELKSWSKAKFGNNREKVDSLLAELESVQLNLAAPGALANSDAINATLKELWALEEKFWHQRSRIKW